MRAGINVKYTHTEGEILPELRATRELRHISDEEIREYLSLWGRHVNGGTLYEPEYDTYYCPDYALDYLASRYGFSCVVCDNVTKPEPEIPTEVLLYRESADALGFLSTGLNSGVGIRRDRPLPICNDCYKSYLTFIRKKAPDAFEEFARKSWGDPNWRECRRLVGLQRELLCLEWVYWLFEKWAKQRAREERK